MTDREPWTAGRLRRYLEAFQDDATVVMQVETATSTVFVPILDIEYRTWPSKADVVLANSEAVGS